MTLAFYFDENIPGLLVRASRDLSLNVQSTPEAGMLGADDPEHLATATATQRVVVTQDVGDFTALHAAWVRQGREHAGIAILVWGSRSPGDYAAGLRRMSDALDAPGMRNRMEFLSRWLSAQ